MENTKPPVATRPIDVVHSSDCAVHNEPAFPNGPCGCGADIAAFESVCGLMKDWLEYIRTQGVIEADLHIEFGGYESLLKKFFKV